MSVTRIAALALCFAIAACDTPPMPAESSISVVEQGARFDVTVPKSDVTLRVPKADLRPGAAKSGGATNSPRYFLLNGRELIVSGWIEPARLYPGPVEGSLKTEFAQLAKAGVAAPTHVEKQRIGAFDAVVYDMALPGENAAHVRATYLDAGTWIDLHVSIHAARSPAELRAAVVDVVQHLAIERKS